MYKWLITKQNIRLMSVSLIMTVSKNIFHLLTICVCVYITTGFCQSYNISCLTSLRMFGGGLMPLNLRSFFFFLFYPIISPQASFIVTLVFLTCVE